jgi:hypothetical protein
MTLEQRLREEFVEKGADLEHNRWARWQKYFFSKCQIKPQHEVGGNDDRYVYFALRKDLYERWTRQIETTYADLSEAEKESDRKETRNYLPLLSHAIAETKKEIAEWAKERKKARILIPESNHGGKRITIGYHKAFSEIIAHLSANKKEK